jgi:hypothetical protein
MATVATEQQHRLDRRLLEQRFGQEAVHQCKAPTSVTTIRLKPKVQGAGAPSGANPVLTPGGCTRACYPQR